MGQFEQTTLIHEHGRIADQLSRIDRRACWRSLWNAYSPHRHHLVGIPYCIDGSDYSHQKRFEWRLGAVCLQVPIRCGRFKSGSRVFVRIASQRTDG